MSKGFTLTEAAKDILLNEGAKEIFDANISSKAGTGLNVGVGNSQVNPTVAYGNRSAGLVGNSPELKDDELPDYLAGTPKAKPPGATPPVGSQPDGVGATRVAAQPQDTMGRPDLIQTQQYSATEYGRIRDRQPYTPAPQTSQRYFR